MTARVRRGHFLGTLIESPDQKKSRYLSHRVVELAAPKSRKFQDGTYDYTWGSQAPIRKISQATLSAEASSRLEELAKPKQIRNHIP